METVQRAMWFDAKPRLPSCADIVNVDASALPKWFDAGSHLPSCVVIVNEDASALPTHSALAGIINPS